MTNIRNLPFAGTVILIGLGMVAIGMLYGPGAAVFSVIIANIGVLNTWVAKDHERSHQAYYARTRIKLPIVLAVMNLSLAMTVASLVLGLVDIVVAVLFIAASTILVIARMRIKASSEQNL